MKLLSLRVGLTCYFAGGARGGRGARFAQGLGNQMPNHISQTV